MHLAHILKKSCFFFFFAFSWDKLPAPGRCGETNKFGAKRILLFLLIPNLITCGTTR